MASYDSAGFTDRTPAGPVGESTGAGSGSAITPQGMMTPQSAQAMGPEGAELATVNLTSLLGGSVAEDVPQVFGTIHANDTGVPAQSLMYGGRETFSGVALDSGGSGPFQPAGMGPFLANQAVDHPNALPVPGRP